MSLDSLVVVVWFLCLAHIVKHVPSQYSVSDDMLASSPPNGLFILLDL